MADTAITIRWRGRLGRGKVGGMNSQQRRILETIHTDPIPDGIEWTAIETFLAVLGCTQLSGPWGRVRFMRAGVVGMFQRSALVVRPHQIRDVRDYLTAAGLRL